VEKTSGKRKFYENRKKSLKNRKFLEFLAENQILGTLDAFTIFFNDFCVIFLEKL